MAGKVPWRVHSWGQLRQSTRRPGAPWKPRRLFEPTSPVPPSTLALVYAAWRSNVGPVVDRAGALATARMALHALKYNVLGSSSNQRPWRWLGRRKRPSRRPSLWLSVSAGRFSCIRMVFRNGPASACLTRGWGIRSGLPTRLHQVSEPPQTMGPAGSGLV